MQRIPNYIPAALWFCLILYATLSNLKEIELLNWRNLFSYDKPIHMILFGTQAWLVIYARTKSDQFVNINVLVVVCLFTAAFGASIEYLQVLLTTTRSFDYFDMIANAAGCLLAYFLLKRRYQIA